MRRFVIGLAVIAGLAGAADVGARLAAEAVVSERLQESAALPQRPDVDVGGWPFLTQAVSGEYRDVRVTTGVVPTSGVDLASLDVRLRGVRAPLGDALRGAVAELPVSAVLGTAVVGYEALASAAGPVRVTVAPDGDLVRVSGTLEVLGSSVAATAVSRARLDGDVLVVTAVRYEVAGRVASAAISRALGGRLDLRIPLERLPYGLRVTGVAVAPEGVRVAVRGDATVLRAGRPAAPAALQRR